MDIEALAKQNEIDAHDLTEALRYGSYDPSYGQKIGVNVIDDVSQREYNQEWTIALIFELNDRRYGYYRDGAQTVLDELTTESTVSEWAAQWDAEHIPDLLTATIQDGKANSIPS